MNNLLSKQFYTVLVLAFIALLLNAAIPIYSIQLLKQVNEDTLASRDNIETLDSSLLNVIDAETGTRGYVITGNSSFLQPYFSSQERLNTLLPKLEKSLASFDDSSAMVKEFNKRIRFTLTRLEKTINTRQLEEPEVAFAMVKSGEGKKRMDAVRFTYHQLRLLETNKLFALQSRQLQVEDNTNIAMLLLTLIDLVLFGFAFKFLLKSLKTSKSIQQDLNALHNETLINSQLLLKKNHTKNMQAKLIELLQAVQTQDEAFLAITNYGKQLFPDYSGAFYVKSNSKDYFERKSQWGALTQVEGFEPDGCWAVRSNSIYNYDEITKDMPCKHNLDIHHKHIAVCLPSLSTDEMLGVLTLVDSLPIDTTHQFDEETKNVASEVVGHIGLALTNLRLKEHLKKSAIVDSLTGLYNRRYLNETLGREIARANRVKQSLGIIMLDVDHFKMFNDSYGHEAGDLVLKKVGDLLKHFSRASDIACRYGGEEFVLVLPEADIDTVKNRANEFRLAVKTISLLYGGTVLPTISISAGISVFPQHGTDADELLKKADDALYQAKRNGRDQIQTYRAS